MMELSKYRILHHDTGGLFAGHDEFFTQLDDFAERLRAQGSNPSDAMSKWLECGKHYSLNKRSLQGIISC